VVSADVLQSRNVTDISDLQRVVPTVAGVGQTLAIRGVGTGASTIGAQSKVGIVLDDVPQPSRSTIANNLQDIERVEVLPGPQGTLAGRNATGGLINLVTRGPSNEWTGFINISGTSDHERQAAVFVAGPISDKIEISLSQYYKGFRGLYKNIYLNKWADDYVVGSRNKVRIHATDSLTLNGTLYYQYSHRNGVGGQGGGPNGGNPIIYAATPAAGYAINGDIRTPKATFSQFEPGVNPGVYNNEYASSRNGETHTSDLGAVGKVEFVTPGNVTLSSITSYLDESNPIHTDFCGCVSNVADLNIRPEFTGFADILNATSNFNQEFRINSPAAGRLHYVGGLFYSYLKQTYNYQRFFQPVDWLRDFYSRSWSAYGHADYDLTDRLKIQGGVRVEKDRVWYNWTFVPILATSKTTSDAVVRSFPTTNTLIVNTNSDSGSFVNWDAGVQYKVTPDVMVYATFSRAQQGPIFDSEDNLTAIKQALTTLPQEKVRNVEVGFKSQLFDRRLTLNVSLFQGKYDNYQVQTNVPNPDPLQPPTLKVASVGKVRTRGAEVAASGRISSRLKADLNLAYTEALIQDFANAPCYTGSVVGTPACYTVNAGTASAFNTQGNLAGELLNRAPRLRATLSFEYSVPVGSHDLEAYISPLIKYASSQRTDLLRLPTSYMPRTTFVDVTMGLRNKSVTAELFVRNLFKEFAPTYTVPATGFSPTTGILNRVLDRANTRYGGVRLKYSF